MKILYVVPYKQLFPPRNGGMLRNYYLVHELSKYTTLTLVVLQPNSDFRHGEEGYAWNNSIRIISPGVTLSKSTFLTKLVNAIKGRYYRKSLFESSNAFLLQTYPPLKRLLKVEKFDIVVFAHLQSLVLFPLVMKYQSEAFCIFDAHNIDHLLYAQENSIVKGKNRKEYNRLKRDETTLYKKINFFLACSLKDKDFLENLNQYRLEGTVIPNGADTDRMKFQTQKDYSKKNILFCGSLDYLPNHDGLLWFYNSVWPKLKQTNPDLILTVIGRNGINPDYETMKNDSSVDFIGQVDFVDSFYYKSIIAVVPLHKGSGTRLKILEAMCLGCPVVSTTIGAEGIDYEDLVNIMIADSDQSMFEAINYLLLNPEKCDSLRVNARKLIVEKYSWNTIGERFAKTLNNKFLQYKNA